MEDYVNLIVMGIVAVFVIGFGLWINWKLGAKKRATAKAQQTSRRRATASANRQTANGAADDFAEEYIVPEDNSLPDDDDDGEFKDTNLFGLKRRKDGPNVFKDWD